MQNSQRSFPFPLSHFSRNAGVSGTILDRSYQRFASCVTSSGIGSMTCLTLLLALSGCGDNAFSPKSVEIAAIKVAASASVGAVEGATPATSVGGTLTLVALDEAGNEIRDVDWSTSDIHRAGISGPGVVNGLSVGEAVISAKVDGRGKGQKIRIEKGHGNGNGNGNGKAQSVAMVLVSPESYAVAYGGTVQLVATTFDDDDNVLSGRVVTWATSNTAVATVSSSGVVSARGSGPVEIAASSEGQSAVAQVTVAAPPSTSIGSVTVAPSSLTLEVGSTAKLAATVKASDGSTLSGQSVTWSTSNSSVAKVASDGRVTAVASGLAKITATSGGKSAAAEVVVPTSATVPTPPAGEVPQAPAVGSSVLLFDFRPGSTMPKGHGGGFASAGNFGEVLGSLGTGNYNDGWGATADVDGRGTRALMGTYNKAGDCNEQQEKKANLQLLRPARALYFSYMTRLGRSPSGEGMSGGAVARGEVNAFRAQSSACENKGGKRLRIVQEEVTLPDGSTLNPIFSHQWRGGDVATDVTGDISGTPGAHLFPADLYSTERMVGKPVRMTVELRASSGLSGSMDPYMKFKPDGLIRVWVDGVLAYESTTIRIGSSDFTRINLMSRLNSPSFDMTDYWWDMVAWTPGAR